LQLCEEEDDATSPLVAPKPEPNDQTMQAGARVIVQEVRVLFLLELFIHFSHNSIYFEPYLKFI